MEMSKFGKINWRDLLNGAFYSGIAVVAMFILQCFANKHIPIDSASWIDIGYAAGSAFLGRFIGGIFINSDGKIFKPELPKQ